jgi:glucokinase
LHFEFFLGRFLKFIKRLKQKIMSKEYFIGYDIGGSSVKAVLVDPVRNGVSNGASKKIIKSSVEDLSDNLEKLLLLVVKMKSDLAGGIPIDKIGGVGVGLAGCLDSQRANMLRSFNIKYLDSQPIKKLLEEKLKPYPIRIEHDVNCFLLAEKEIGLAKNFKNVFYLTLGTGIGGAYMIDGKIISGSHGAAGEAGHMIIKIKNPRPRPGSAEGGQKSPASPSEAGRAKIKINEAEDLENLASNKLIKKILGIGSIEAEKRARAGDRNVQQVFAQLGRNLGFGIANIINIFDPEAVILSGGIAHAKEFILPTIKEGIAKYVISPAAKETKILFSELGREGGALGAALLFAK